MAMTGVDIDALTESFVRSMELEREQRAGAGARTYVKEGRELQAEIGRVKEVGKAAQQKAIEIESEAKRKSQSEALKNLLITLPLLAMGASAIATTGGAAGAPLLKTLAPLLKGSKGIKAATVLSSLFSAGKGSKAGREVIEKRSGEIPIAKLKNLTGESRVGERLQARRDATSMESATRGLKAEVEQQYQPMGGAVGEMIGASPEAYDLSKQMALPILSLLSVFDMGKTAYSMLDPQGTGSLGGMSYDYIHKGQKQFAS